MLARNGRHRRLQHAVDAVLDEQRIVVGLDVDVRRAPLERGEDRRVHQADDRPDVFFRGQLLDRDIFVRVLLGEITSKVSPSRRLIQHALRLLRLLQEIGDLRQRGHARDHALAQQAGDLVQHHQAARIADRDHQPVLHLLQRNEVVAEHHVHRHRAEQVVLDPEVLQVNELAAIAGRERPRARRLIRQIGKASRQPEYLPCRYSFSR